MLSKNEYFKFNSYKTIGIIVGICFLTGILGGVIGIAGGIILAPLFLQMGMLPQVVANTNQYLAMFQTLSVTSQYFYLGMVNIPYCFLLAVIV